jgi:crossover junction endodeoxyribonuclease RuvC
VTPSETSSERVLAVDPSLRGTGFAVLERSWPGKRLGALAWGVIRNAPSLSQSGCLVAIHEKITELIAQYSPRAAAFESVIFVQSYQTAIVLGCARGAALLASAQHGLPIFEYPPKRVKQAVVGRGGAQKEQVAFMVRALLGLSETPAADAADALAVGLAHFQAVDAARVGVKSMEAI